MEEKELIRLSQKNIKHFDALYERYNKRIYNYLKTKVNRDKFIAEDLTSETFEKAIKNINSFKWQGVSFSAWIFKIANRTLIDYYRFSSVRKPGGIIHENISDKEKEIEEKVIESDSNSRIKNAIFKLKKLEQEILILKFYEGYTNKAISGKLKISETNVGTKIYRSMKKLKELIER